MRWFALLFALFTASVAVAQAPPPMEPRVVQGPGAPAPAAPVEIPQAEPEKVETPPPAPRPRRVRAPRRQAPPPPPPPTTDLPAFVTDEDIAVTSDYRGSRITTLGMNPDRRGRGDIVVALRGPNQPTVVRRKVQFLGLWVNGDPVRFDAAPSFLAVYSARPLRDIASPRAIWTLRLDPAASARLAGATPAGADPSAYRQALVRLRRQDGLYIENPRGLRVREPVFFVAEIRLPANAPLGDYVSDVYHFRDGRLISSRSSEVTVSRQGLERTIHDLATRWPFLYGLCVVVFALGAGWGAAAMFRRG